MIKSISLFDINSQNISFTNASGKKNLLADNKTDERLKVPNIRRRMKMHCHAKSMKNPCLLPINLDKFDRYYKQDIFYLDEDYHDILCDNFVKFLKTGNEIQSPHVELYEKNGKLLVACVDGRHRYRILKNMGMKVMPMTMSEESKQLAQKQ